MLNRAYPRKFYIQPTLTVARELLGAILCRKLSDGTILHGPIVEVEAYTSDDPACHAFKGRTPRSEVMFGPPGHAYVYFIYGMYHCLNVVTEPKDTAGAVLIRAVGAIGTNGPGKLCKQWQINSTHNGASLLEPNSSLWIAQAKRIPDNKVEITTRIGISSAKDHLWRYYIREHESVSKPTHKKVSRSKSKSKSRTLK